MTNTMKKRLLASIFAILIFNFISPIIYAQETVNLSLKQAQEYALLNNVDMKNSQLDLQLAKKKIWETTAIGLPQISAQANYQHLFEVPELVLGGETFLATNLPAGTPLTSDNITNEGVFLDFAPGMPIPLGAKDNTTLDFTVTQLLFSGEYLVGLRAARVFYQISEQGRIKTEEDVRESIANTYSLVLMLQNNLDVMTRSLENMNATLREMKALNQQGFIEVTDVDQIELTTLTLENGVTSMERQFNASKDLLKFQIGMPMNTEINLTEDLDALATDVNLEALVANEFKVEQNINFKILDTQVALSKLNLQRDRSTYLPNLAAVYRHTEKFTEIDFDFTPVDVFMLTLNIPIFSSGQRLSRVQQRKIEYEKAINNKDNVSNGLQLEYINARNEMINAYDSYNNVKKNLELTGRIYDKTLIKFQEGLSTSMDLTQAQNQFLSAQNAYINNLQTLLTAKNKLTKLTTNH